MNIQLEHLTKTFHSPGRKSSSEVVAVNDFTFEIPDGQLIGLLGPSGCGKSTTLNLICGLEQPTSGKIFFGDRDVTALPPELRGVGMVFQNYQLFPHRNVLQNLIEAPVYHKLMSKEDAVQKAEKLLERLQISDKLHAYPSTLSGGQKQRVAIARACMLQPSVLCFDEPTSALDVESIASVTSIIKDLSKEMAILIITHDEVFAQRVGTRVVKITDINR